MKNKTKSEQKNMDEKDMESRNTTGSSKAMRDEKDSTMPRNMHKNISDDMDKNQGGKNSFTDRTAIIHN